jgi:hypothetical protein
MKFGPSRLEMTLLTGTTYFDRNWLAHRFGCQLLLKALALRTIRL